MNAASCGTRILTDAIPPAPQPTTVDDTMVWSLKVGEGLVCVCMAAAWVTSQNELTNTTLDCVAASLHFGWTVAQPFPQPSMHCVVPAPGLASLAAIQSGAQLYTAVMNASDDLRVIVVRLVHTSPKAGPSPALWCPTCHAGCATIKATATAVSTATAASTATATATAASTATATATSTARTSASKWWRGPYRSSRAANHSQDRRLQVLCVRTMSPDMMARQAHPHHAYMQIAKDHTLLYDAMLQHHLPAAELLDYDVRVVEVRL